MWQDKEKQNQPLLEEQKRLSADPSFKGVREHNRKCNDILFGVLFLLVFGGMISIGIFGFAHGDPSKLIPSSQWTNQIENKGEYWFQDSVAELKQNLDVLGVAVGVAFILALVWVQLMKKLTGIFVYLTLALGTLGVLAAALYCLFTGLHQANNTLKILSYCLFGIFGLIVIGLFFLRNKISLTVALITECCRGIQHNPAVFIVGFIVSVMFVAFGAFWFAQFIFLYSIPSDTVVNIDSKIPQFNQPVRNLMLFQVFAFYWTNNLISAFFQMSIAGAVASWYFSRDVNGYGKSIGSPAFRSFGRALTKSFGSLAIGALILAIVQFINFIVKQLKCTNRTNRALRCLLGCIECIVGCVQRFVAFVDKYTYIYIAMHGESFFSSAKQVYGLVSRQSISTLVIEFITEFVLMVGKLMGTAGVTLGTVVALGHLGRAVSSVTVSAVVVVAFLVFHLFSHVIGVGVDTVFVCYLEDLERNKEGRLYADPSMHNLIQMHARKVEAVVN